MSIEDESFCGPPQKKKYRSRPKRWRKLFVLDNKFHPDYYVAGLVMGFLGLQWLEPWYPILLSEEGVDSYVKGKMDAEQSAKSLVGEIEYAPGIPHFCDYVGDLWRVRNTDPKMFDGAVLKKYGHWHGNKIIEEIEKQGRAPVLEMNSEIVGEIFELLERKEEIENAQF